MMSLLIKYLGLCWFRNNPIDLIPERAFMWKVILFYYLSGWLVEGLIADPADGFLEVSLRIVMAFSSIAVFLFSTNRWIYFNQLFTAIFVCENFIMTLATAAEGLDLVLIMKHYPYREAVGITLATFLVVWYLVIVAYILRQMFEFKMSRSLVFAFGYFVLTYGIPMMFMDM